MKKYFYMILLYAIFLPINVKALDASVTMNCTPSEVKKGGEITCVINLQTEDKIKKVEGLFTYDPTIIDLITPGITGNAISILDETSDGLSTTSPIANIKFKVKEGATESTGINPLASITLSNLRVTNYANDTKDLSTITFNYRVLSTNNSLNSLSVDGSNITLDDKTNYSYTLTSDKSSISINYNKGHPNQVVTVSYKGKNITSNTISNLDYGNNIITINVHPEDGQDKTYTLTVIRPDNRSTVNTLSSLTVKDESKTYNINFSSNTLTYTINVASNINSVTITAKLTDAKSKFVTNYAPGVKELEYGKNIIYLKVQSEKGDIKTYTITINRPDNRSSNAYLKNIKLDYGNLSFDKNVFEYTLTVPYAVSSVNVSGEAEDKKATIKVIGNADLIVGENVIKIEVTAENGDKKEYEITITRQEKEAASPSNNTYLSKLIIDKYDLEFDKNTYTYELIIDSKDKSLSISTATEDTKANYRILNNENLTDGSQVKIRVTAEDGSTKDYVINIKVKNTLDIALLGAIVALGTGIIILTIVIILKSRLKRKNKNKKIIVSDQSKKQEEVLSLDDENDEYKTQNIVFTSKKDV